MVYRRRRWRITAPRRPPTTVHSSHPQADAMVLRVLKTICSFFLDSFMLVHVLQLSGCQTRLKWNHSLSVITSVPPILFQEVHQPFSCRVAFCVVHAQSFSVQSSTRGHVSGFHSLWVCTVQLRTWGAPVPSDILWMCVCQCYCSVPSLGPWGSGCCHYKLTAPGNHSISFFLSLSFLFFLHSFLFTSYWIGQREIEGQEETGKREWFLQACFKTHEASPQQVGSRGSNLFPYLW